MSFLPYPNLTGTDPASIAAWINYVTGQRLTDVTAFNQITGQTSALSTAGVPIMEPNGIGSIISAEYTGAPTLNIGSTCSYSVLAVVDFLFSTGAPNHTSDVISGTWQALQTITSTYCGLFQKVSS